LLAPLATAERETSSILVGSQSAGGYIVSDEVGNILSSG